MPKILLIGGQLDGQVRDVPDHILGRREYVVKFPIYAVSVEDFVPSETAEVPPPKIDVESYRLFTINVCDPYYGGANKQITFAHHFTMEATEALVMLMQFYQNKENRDA